MSVIAVQYLLKAKQPQEPNIVLVQVQGPASYTTGGFTVSIPGIRNVIGVVAQSIAYGAVVASPAGGNAVNIKVYSTTGTPMSEIASGTALTSYVISLMAIGY